MILFINSNNSSKFRLAYKLRLGHAVAEEVHVLLVKDVLHVLRGGCTSLVRYITTRWPKKHSFARDEHYFGAS